MTAERWSRIKEVFAAALEMPEPQRPRFLESACGGDVELRAEVERLLAGNEEPSWQSPVAELFAAKLAPGDMLAHYRIVEKLGEGGMGVVYKARDGHLDRFVAIKVLPWEKVGDPARKSRFVQEAKSASALNHPNIVHIYDFGQDSGIDFIAMEYVAGKSLNQVISRKGLALAQTLKYGIQVAGALGRAHSAGIIHRDLKPANIMVDEHGLVKVLDFGLAKLTEPVETDEHAPTRTMEPQTEEGMIVGTAAYMSPEQARGKKADTRSDIFSFGVLLYEMASGRQPFHRDTKISTLEAVLNQEPPPLPNGIPRDLEKLIIRCLRKDPDRRFQHMADIRVALEELKEESEPGRSDASTPVVPRKSKRVQAIRWVALLVTIVIASAGVWFLRQKAPSATLPEGVPLTSYPGHEQYPSFSPDGNQVAFSWNGEKQDNFDIYVKLVGPGTYLRLTSDPAVDTSPAWSPDGRSIAFVRVLSKRSGRVILVPALGGPERELLDVPITDYLLPTAFLAWSPDSKWLVVPDKASGRRTGLMLLSVESGETRRLTMPGRNIDVGPAFSPDGRTLAFLRAPQGGVNDVYVLGLSNDLNALGNPRRLTSNNGWISGLAWTPEGREIVFSSRGLWRIGVSGAAEPQALTPVGGISTVAISRHTQTGHTRLAYSQAFEDANIWRVEVSSPERGAKYVPLIVSTRGEWAGQFSADGKRIAFISNRSGVPAIWVCDRDGSNAVQIVAFGGRQLSAPHWSPSGGQLAFEAAPEGPSHVYTVNANGSGLKRLTNDPARDSWPSWSRDGRWIYFNSRRAGADGQGRIWKMPAGGGAAIQVTRNGGSIGLESPDGKYLYYGRFGDTQSVWKVPVDGGEETQVIDHLSDWSCFAVMEEGIYFIPDTGPRSSIQLLNFATGKIQHVADLEKRLASGLSVAVAPDGRARWIIYSQTDQEGADLMLVENFR